MIGRLWDVPSCTMAVVLFCIAPWAGCSADDDSPCGQVCSCTCGGIGGACVDSCVRECEETVHGYEDCLRLPGALLHDCDDECETAFAEGTGDGCPGGCDDGIDCTADRCEESVCRSSPLHARCHGDMYCDPAKDCSVPPACQSVDDCPDYGPCSITTCNPSTATCFFRDLDNDGDGHSPVICGGGDCDDANASTFPSAPETCNGVDDDCDGEIDGLPGCESNTERECDDLIDNDADGQTDCDDPDCETICVADCPAGSRGALYVATDLPQTIIDQAAVGSTISVLETDTVESLAVRFSATHTWVGDLDVSLVSAEGTAIDLSSDNGDSGGNYTNTLFLDSASTSITEGSPPFTGSFRPEEPLANLNGEGTAGLWTLEVYDDTPGDTGTFTQYELYICW